MSTNQSRTSEYIAASIFISTCSIRKVHLGNIFHRLAGCTVVSGFLELSLNGQVGEPHCGLNTGQ